VIGSHALSSLKNKGMAMTGSIMLFVTSGELLIYFILSMTTIGMVFEAIRLGFFSQMIVPIVHYLSAVLAAIFGLIAGLRGMASLNCYQT
jgi:hypothetical protein